MSTAYTTFLHFSISVRLFFDGCYQKVTKIMARIRTIKPAFWSSPTVATLSRDARLLAIGLMSFADDDGRFPASLHAIQGYVFPNDSIPPARVKRWVSELQESGFIHLYEVASAKYGCIPTWHRHQVINRYSPSNLPQPDVDCIPRKGSRDQPVTHGVTH